MKEITLGGQRVALYALDTVVVGSGCAGFNAADTLFDLGRRDIALLTEGVNMGTSRNTGSDKQTYYKLSLCADAQDSVYQLAENLFAGGSVNGDTALAEAAGSVRSFMKLVNLGVPFPTNRYGEYVGYKTDHDPRQRATSCGPLTSKVMTEKLEASVRQKGIPLLDGFQAVRLLVEEGRVAGLVALDKSRLSQNDWGLAVFLCGQVVLATGGPAIAYGRTVYPPSQTGSTGLALEAGAAGCNLQEWQYGLASVKFRWNVSGTYQQVLPRYISVDGRAGSGSSWRKPWGPSGHWSWCSSRATSGPLTPRRWRAPLWWTCWSTGRPPWAAGCSWISARIPRGWSRALPRSPTRPGNTWSALGPASPRPSSGWPT